MLCLERSALTKYPFPCLSHNWTRQICTRLCGAALAALQLSVQFGDQGNKSLQYRRPDSDCYQAARQCRMARLGSFSHPSNDRQNDSSRRRVTALATLVGNWRQHLLRVSSPSMRTWATTLGRLFPTAIWPALPLEASSYNSILTNRVFRTTACAFAWKSEWLQHCAWRMLLTYNVLYAMHTIVRGAFCHLSICDVALDSRSQARFDSGNVQLAEHYSNNGPGSNESWVWRLTRTGRKTPHDRIANILLKRIYLCGSLNGIN